MVPAATRASDTLVFSRFSLSRWSRLHSVITTRTPAETQRYGSSLCVRAGATIEKGKKTC